MIKDMHKPDVTIVEESDHESYGKFKDGIEIRKQDAVALRKRNSIAKSPSLAIDRPTKATPKGTEAQLILSSDTNSAQEQAKLKTCSLFWYPKSLFKISRGKK